MTETNALPRLVARVVPDVTGLDKHFDYLVPESMAGSVAVGSLVRVALHGRRVGGWVAELIDERAAGVDPARLVPIAKWSSIGPSESIVDLARWASVRWGAGRLRPFLAAASPPTMAVRLPPSRRTLRSGSVPASDDVRRLSPFADPLPMVVEAAQRGPTIAVHPSPRAAHALAARLRRAGLSVALLPGEWAAAAGGVDVVVGSRTAAWAPCDGLAAVVVIDEHDEAYQEERSPTWHARDVLIERARRAGASCWLLSPAPTLSARRWVGRPPAVADTTWPRVEIDDRSDVEPWRRSIVGSRLIELLRDADRRVVCVLNAPGRARLLACRSCKSLQRCERCTAAVMQPDEAVLSCPRCAASRPVVCQRCGATALSNVRPGVTRLREELESAAGRPVLLVTGAVSADDEAQSLAINEAGVVVGTEAVLHRAGRADAVVFLDIDAEVLAPRYRASEHVVALVVRAGRLVGRPEGGGVVVLQTHDPGHPVVQALASGDLESLVDDEASRRAAMRLPPFAALAALEGAAAAAIAESTGLEWARTAKGALLRADDWMALGEAIIEVPRPRGSSCRVEVDPPRA